MDKFYDFLGEEIAEQAKKKGNQKVYDAHEKRSYENYVRTARETGEIPLTKEEIRKKKQQQGFQIDLSGDFNLSSGFNTTGIIDSEY